MHKPLLTPVFTVVLIAASMMQALAQDAPNRASPWPFLVFLVFLVFALIMYPLPTFVAFSKRHPNRWVILGLNLILGGTGIVWFGCLIWAMMKVHDPKDAEGSRGGESGLNIFANDIVRVKVEGESATPPSARAGAPGWPSDLPSSPAPGPDTLSRLERLQRLRDQGVIDDEQLDRMSRRYRAV